MGNEAVLHFFCGKMIAGKSTLARQLAQKTGGILLVEDELLLQLYPEEIVDIASYVKYSHRLKSAISNHLRALLRRGTSVILDFPGNTPNGSGRFSKAPECLTNSIFWRSRTRFAKSS